MTPEPRARQPHTREAGSPEGGAREGRSREPRTPAELDPRATNRPGRRGLLLAGTAGAGALGVGAAAVGLDRALRGSGPTPGPADQAEAPLHGEATLPFHGEHQAGVGTPAQASSSYLALDLHEEVDRAGIIRMMRLLTDDAARLTQGRPALADTEPELATAPARLTVTFGFGPGLLERAQVEAPPWLGPLPAFEIDELQEEFCGGDLLLQVASDDPLTVSHAARMLLKDSRAFTTVRWVQQGFRRAHGTERPGVTQRNLFGQVDGSANPQLDSNHFDTVVWIDEGPFAGGTSMVIRRIRMDLDGWDEADPAAREQSTGTKLSNGAPLSGQEESDHADFEARSEHGFPLIPEFSHMRRARGVDEGVHDEIFRRPYNYEDPPAPGSGALSESGQIFTSFQADLEGQFIPIQQRLSDLDLLNMWTTPIGSAVFAIPPGCAEGEFVGQSVIGD